MAKVGLAKVGLSHRDSVDGASFIEAVPLPESVPAADPVVLEPRRRMVADAFPAPDLVSLKEVFQLRAHVIRVVLQVVRRDQVSHASFSKKSSPCMNPGVISECAVDEMWIPWGDVCSAER